MPQPTNGEMMKKLIFALLMFISCSVWAEWVVVGESTSDGTTFNIDPATVRREGTLLRYWKLTNLTVQNKSGNMSWRTREELDCKRERYRLTSMTTFSGPMLGGKINGSFSWPDDEWTDIAPGTMNETVMKYVCAK